MWYKKILAGGLGPCNYLQNIANTAWLAFLYKKGGMYLDMDIIMMASYVSLPVNIADNQGWEYSLTHHTTCSLNNTEMSFEPQNLFLLAYMQEFVVRFWNCIWGWNGPDCISNTCSRYRCNNTSNTIWPPSGKWWMPWR